MSVTELPVSLFLQRSTAFCNSLQNDLEEFIRKVHSDFASVNREIKIAPNVRRKSTIGERSGSCTLDVKEFTRSKENVLRTVKANFADMETKWDIEAQKLKDWFFMNIESCLSKIQLQVTVTAEELNLAGHECEVDLCEESSSSSSEVELLVPQQTRRQPLGLSHTFTPAKKRVSFAGISEAKRRKVQAGKTTGVTVTEHDKDRTVVNVPHVFSPAVGNSEQDISIKKTDWMSLSRAAEVAPTKPGMYEVKQSRAKNTAYIGHSEDLQKCLCHFWEGKSSRDKQKKQLENFIQRNKEEISVRYEVHFSPQLAKLAWRNKLKEFVEHHKKPPSQNYEI